MLTDIQIVLIVIMVLVIIAEMWVIRRRRKVRKERRYDASASDRAFNTILATERIYDMALSRGIVSEEGRAHLREARRLHASGRFTEAVEMAEAAREKLAEARRGVQEMQSAPASPEKPQKEEERKEELPENYMQSKFMIATAEEALRVAEQKGAATASSRSALEDARRAFEREEYTSALSKALRARKILQGLPLSPPSEAEDTALVDVSAPIPAASGEKEGKLCCQQCGAEVGDDDRFCRKCGVKIEFALLCPQCSAEVGDGDRFCRKCGTSLK